MFISKDLLYEKEHCNFTGSGIVEAEWLNITNSIATPANTWYAGSSSVNGGNNTGWIFDVAFTPVIMWF